MKQPPLHPAHNSSYEQDYESQNCHTGKHARCVENPLSLGNEITNSFERAKIFPYNDRDNGHSDTDVETGKNLR